MLQGKKISSQIRQKSESQQKLNEHKIYGARTACTTEQPAPTPWTPPWPWAPAGASSRAGLRRWHQRPSPPPRTRCCYPRWDPQAPAGTGRGTRRSDRPPVEFATHTIFSLSVFCTLSELWSTALFPVSWGRFLLFWTADELRGVFSSQKSLRSTRHIKFSDTYMEY